MQEIQFDQNAENAGLKANETASTGHDDHCLKSSGYETNHLITDKLSFYSDVLKSDRPNLSEKTWPNWDFFDFQMNLAERVLSAERHMVLGLEAIEPADRSKISNPVGLRRAIASAFTGEAQSLWIESEMRSDVNPTRVSFLDRRRGIFAGANQTVALSCFHKNAETDIFVQHLALEPSGEFTSEPLGRFPLPPSLYDPWILPRSAYQARIAPRLPHLFSRLSDLGYSAHTGPVIWNRFKRRLSRDPKPRSVPLIWAEAITYEGSFKWAAERKNNMRWFKLKPDEAHLQCSEPCILVQRTTSPDQDRRLMTAKLPEAFLDTHGAVVVENHVNMIRPKQSDAKVPLSTLAAFLGSVAAEEAFRGVIHRQPVCG